MVDDMNGLPKVCVLLSTYNGENFLPELLESLSRQQDVNVTILARDDGSADHTTDILQNFSGCDIQIIKGTNKGATESFFCLIDMHV